jgi:hypothetical protein
MFEHLECCVLLQKLCKSVCLRCESTTSYSSGYIFKNVGVGGGVRCSECHMQGSKFYRGVHLYRRFFVPEAAPLCALKENNIGVQNRVSLLARQICNMFHY